MRSLQGDTAFRDRAKTACEEILTDVWISGGTVTW
jgi:hypothetical protein